MNCYEPRLGKHYIGGEFIMGNGIFRMIPDKWLHEAKIEHDGNKLRLCYSSCTIEITGYRLEKIYRDTVEGKLGKVIIADPSDDMEAANSTEEPFVTNIVHMVTLPGASTDLERNN